MSWLSQLGAKGFRPFFLLAGIFSALVVPLWMLVFTGAVPVRGPLQGVLWHAHEMLFGFTVAVIAGFLLTAAENWTQQVTLRGAPLLALAATWGSARVALVVVPGWTGAVLDVVFLPVVMAGLGRALVGAGSRRNYPFLGLLCGLWLANVMVYGASAAGLDGQALVAHRVAVYLIAVIILVVTGRVVPMFTRNATGVGSLYSLPWLDRVAIGATLGVALLQLWPVPPLLPGVAAVAGVAVLARTTGWWTGGVFTAPLLWVLHAGHAAVGVGLLLLAVQPWLSVPASAPLHTLTVGGIGLLTIGMMARVSLGHTGRVLTASKTMTAAFALVGLSLVLRVAGPWLSPGATLSWLWAGAACWALAFALFSVVYLPILTSPRVDGKPG